MPSSTTRPPPISPTVSPSTLTEARVTRCTTARMLRLFFRRLARPDFDAARQAALVVVQQIEDDAGDVCGLQLPTLCVVGCVAAEVCLDRDGHDVDDVNALVPHILHKHFAAPVK